MSLENKVVRLHVHFPSLKAYGSGKCLSTDTTLGELVSACHSKQCPMGIFSCPIFRSVDCGEVTAKMWADVFDAKEEDDAR